MNSRVLIAADSGLIPPSSHKKARYRWLIGATLNLPGFVKIFLTNTKVTFFIQYKKSLQNELASVR
jgi:hypothetical protein